MNTLHFKVSGMHCGACLKVIAMKVKKINGVIDVNITEDGSVTLVSESPLSLGAVEASLQGTEYTVSAN